MADDISSAELIARALYEQKLEHDRAYKREYMRRWRAKNKDKVKANTERYILAKAERIKAEQENNT